MRVLVACEYSGTVRDAFIRAGHDAISADILPSESDFGPHYQGNVLDLMNETWDLVIAHPPCTYLANSGVQHLYDEARWPLLRQGAQFFAQMFDFKSPRICVENPVQHHWAIEYHGHGKPTQYIEPYMFGVTETKKTGLWLRGLPKLIATNNVKEQTMKLPPKERMPGWWKGGGSGHERSRFWPEIADAMVHQWT